MAGRSQRPETTPEGSGDARPAGASGLVLVVDDDEVFRLITRRVLEQEGFRVEEAVDGFEALRSLDQDPPDLVLLDLRLPRMPGIAACRHIRKHPVCKDVPIILVSGAEQDELAQRVCESGATGFLCKPFRTASLVELARKLACAD